jgi:hypothetical protein
MTLTGTSSRLARVASRDGCGLTSSTKRSLIAVKRTANERYVGRWAARVRNALTLAGCPAEGPSSPGSAWLADGQQSQQTQPEHEQDGGLNSHDAALVLQRGMSSESWHAAAWRVWPRHLADCAPRQGCVGIPPEARPRRSELRRTSPTTRGLRLHPDVWALCGCVLQDTPSRGTDRDGDPRTRSCVTPRNAA